LSFSLSISIKGLKQESARIRQESSKNQQESARIKQESQESKNQASSRLRTSKNQGTKKTQVVVVVLFSCLFVCLFCSVVYLFVCLFGTTLRREEATSLNKR
jgi:ATP-dependent Zn protease